MKVTKIAHIITDLNTGGAELMLHKLITSMDNLRFHSIVIVLANEGPIGRLIESKGINVYYFDMKQGSIPGPKAVFNLIKIIKLYKPDIIQGWMYHGNIAAVVGGCLSFMKIPVIWNIRHSLDNFTEEKLLTKILIKTSALFSRYPKKIIYNSVTSSIQHENIRFAKSRTVIIPNGFDCDVYAPNNDNYIAVRKELGVKQDTFLIGLIARYHKQKGHSDFISAAAELNKKYKKIHFLLAGRAVTWENQELKSIIEKLGLSSNIHLLGEHTDIQRLQSALDIATSSSYCEAFSNAIGEAMSCGVPCVVTDVGDSSYLVDKYGRVIPPGDSQLLMQAWEEIFLMDETQRKALGNGARRRIQEQFSIKEIVKEYERLYESLV